MARPSGSALPVPPFPSQASGTRPYEETDAKEEGNSTDSGEEKVHHCRERVYVYGVHWVASEYDPDLFILEDDEYWNLQTDEHKLAAVTGSFSFATDAYNEHIDIAAVETMPCVNRELYLNNSWHTLATMEEVCKDIENEDLSVRMSTLAAYKSAAPKRKAARREATANEKRLYAKQFHQAKLEEYKSWSKENDIYDLIDMRKQSVQNYITGRWVLTIKRDKDGNFIKCKARWVLRGFQDNQVWNLQTDSPTSTRPGFRLQCQAAANNDWDIVHIDLKTAFLQGERFDTYRDIVCQLPPEAGLPKHMAARLKRAAYGLNDAPRLWWNKLDKALRSYGLVPTRADRCCYVLYSDKKHARFAEPLVEPEPVVWEANSEYLTEDSPDFTLSVAQPSQGNPDVEKALDLLLDPITGSPAKGRKVEGIVNIHVDDACMTGSSVLKLKVIASLRRDFKVGSEDLNDVMFVGQRVKWCDRGTSKARIQVDQERKVEELSEIEFDKSLKDEITCTPDLHKQYRSLLGQINWLQSRTQYSACYLFSRCASAAAGPTVGDIRSLNKLARKIRAVIVVLIFWPLLTASLRLVGMPDAAYRNNSDKSSQRGQVIFLAEARKPKQVNTKGSLVDYESQKIKQTVMSTTVSELYAFMKCFGTCQFLRGLWMDMTGLAVEIHMRTDANNLVTTASTTHLPEQRETIHMINQLRTEACSGRIDDLAHVVSEDCLADPLTKNSAKPDALIKAVTTGWLPNVDKHPPFRELMRNRHKAFMTLEEWIIHNIPAAGDVKCFLGIPVECEIKRCLALTDWYTL